VVLRLGLTFCARRGVMGVQGGLSVPIFEKGVVFFEKETASYHALGQK